MKSFNMLNNKIGDLAEKFAVKGKVKLVGSNQRRGQLFTSDYDLLAEIKGKPDLLARYFKEVMLDISKKQYYFMDFKAGLDKRLLFDFNEDDLQAYLKNELIPESYKKHILDSKGEERVKLIRDLFILRWQPKDIIDGFVTLVDGEKYALKDALMDDTTIKLDIVIPVGDRFAEVSELYVYKHPVDDSKSVLQSLADDIEMYRHSNSMKSLKRLFSMLELTNSEDPRLQKLEAFFNSEYGLLNKCANDLSILLLLTEKHTVPFTKIVSNLQMIKENLALTTLASKQIILSLDKITSKTYRVVCEKMITYLRGLINPKAKDLLRSLE